MLERARILLHRMLLDRMLCKIRTSPAMTPSKHGQLVIVLD